jgi:hypothetical protein
MVARCVSTKPRINRALAAVVQAAVVAAFVAMVAVVVAGAGKRFANH